VVQTEVGGRCPECIKDPTLRGEPVPNRLPEVIDPKRLLRQGLITGLFFGLPGLLAVALLSDKRKRGRRLGGALIGFCVSIVLLVALGLVGVRI